MWMHGELAFYRGGRHRVRMTTERFGPTTEEARRSIRKMKEWGAKMRANPDAAKEFLVKHGFITKAGKLTRRYSA